MLGWNTSTVGISNRRFIQVAKYIARIEELVGVEIGLISTGPERAIKQYLKKIYFSKKDA